MTTTKKKNNISPQNKPKQSATSKPKQTSQVNGTNGQIANGQANTSQSPTISQATEQSPGSKTTPKSIPFPLVLILFTALLISFFGIPLQIIGLLPNEFTGIASGFVVLIGLIFTFWNIGGTGLLVSLLKAFWLRPVMWISIVITVLVLGSTIILPQYIYRHYYTYQPTPTPTLMPTPIPPLLPLPNAKWNQLVSQEAPDCNNNNVQWYEYLGKAFLSCGGHNLAMQDKASTNNPEIYLESIGGKPYNQTNFRVTVQIFFKDLSLISTTAQLVVQTNERNAYSGGYFFLLKPTGEWWLCQQGSCDYSYQALRVGRVYPDMTRPVEMTIEVYKGHLFALINQTEVASIDNTPASTARYIGIRVSQDFSYPSSSSPTVLFSNFKLDVSS